MGKHSIPQRSLDPQRGDDGGCHGRRNVCGLVSSRNRGSEDAPRPECTGQSFLNTERPARGRHNAAVGDDDNAPLDDDHHTVRLREVIDRPWDRNEQRRTPGPVSSFNIAPRSTAGPGTSKSGAAGRTFGPASSESAPAGNVIGPSILTGPTGNATGPVGRAGRRAGRVWSRSRSGRQCDRSGGRVRVGGRRVWVGGQRVGRRAASPAWQRVRNREQQPAGAVSGTSSEPTTAPNSV